MGSALQLINGVQRMRTISTTNPIAYQEAILVPDGGISSGTEITIPNSQTYDDVDLKVYLNGQYLEVNVDYNYVINGGSVANPKNKITLLFDLDKDERIQFIGVTDRDLVYDESVQLTVVAGNPITLPNAETYKTTELEVYLNGQLMEVDIDYNYVGIIPRTQITLTFDVFSTDKIRFRKDFS